MTTCSCIGSRPSTTCSSSMPATSRRTTSGSPSTRGAIGDVAVVNSSSRYALLAVQGPAAVGIVQQLTTVDLASIKYYWFAHGEVGERAQHHLPNRLHGRRRLRAVHSAGIGRARVEYDPRGGRRGWHRAGRPGRARHAAPRGGNAPVRSGHRRDHDRARGRSRMDRRLEESRLHRQGRARRAEARRA